MKKIKRLLKSITLFEYCLWGCSVLAVTLSFALCGNKSYVNLAGAVIGVTSLIFIAKGNVLGNVLSLAFAVAYGVISYYTAYYGEMITYLTMNAPFSLIAIFTWLKNPYGGKKTQVKINSLRAREYILALLLSAAVATAFYFILRALNTANLIWSTVSVFTSFYAVYMSVRRSPFYAVAYCFNDIVLIVLWSLVSVGDSQYVCMVLCFATFLFNDIYGFVNWCRMRRAQNKEDK